MIDTAVLSVEIELQRYFAAARLRATDYGPHYVALWDALEHMSSGGKRVRPALVLASHEGFGGLQQDAATSVAVSFELLHTAFLIHDDLIDSDLTRRGGPNVAGVFRDRAERSGGSERQAESWATTAAVLAGDLALSEAHQLIARLPVEAGVRGALLDLLGRSVFVSAAGELDDVTNTVGGEPMGLPGVLSTLERKTAVYSFEAPLQAGALLAGAGADAIDALGRYARRVGVAFQLVDDLLGVFGDPRVTGKDVLSDLREGKRTTLLAYAQDTGVWPQLAPLVGTGELDEHDVHRARVLLLSCGAAAATEDLARDYAEQAMRELTPAVPEQLRGHLCDLAESAVRRVR
ncbi:polyprenyl synthetase family protein [Compostimonas suwonensis]|uniref:Geranylgeranyl diphosphate synthase type II n=1 Tax=Compostimonas suwonensis TaxID=1048394 RepID=A0A2M9BZH8_9MICO|nr:polyprenyl synthetase family protein [Compostimonas suwonensis]PJJ63482.1 geranylgeranyl diphosphate synthase type II [Compostimonas suwonensis]